MLSPSTQSSGRSALCAGIPLLFFIQKQTQQLKQRKTKKKRKETPVALAPPTPIRPSTGTTLSTSLTFSNTSEGTPAKGLCIDYLLPDPKWSVSHHLHTGLFSFALLSPPKSYTEFIRANHTHKIIRTNKSYAQNHTQKLYVLTLMNRIPFSTSNGICL